MGFGRQPVAADVYPASPLGRSITRGFAVELYFDTALENQILRIWNVLARRRLGNHLIEISARPHVSLSLHTPTDLEPSKLRTAIENFAQQQHPIPVALAAVGSFPAASVPRPLSSPTAVNSTNHASIGNSSVTSTDGGSSSSSSPGARGCSGSAGGGGSGGVSSPDSRLRGSSAALSSSNTNTSSSQPGDSVRGSSLSNAGVAERSTAASALFLTPVPSVALLTLHEQLQELLKRLAIPCDPNYLPGSWLPVCPVAQELPEEKLFCSFHTVRSQKLPLSGYLCEIGLVEFVPSAAGADSRQLSASKADGGMGAVVVSSGDGEKGWGRERGGGVVQGHVIEHYSFTLGGDFM
ncbi:hypothetical protein CLOM_g22855 [Closterium sp. NIES-68]|nr:hypothetical protein CLOM_g22855 [Closterium sp. NIES-68]GJP70298.1 hypothetical protein CLOP_g1246 [Closterium sp. NIES-67]